MVEAAVLPPFVLLPALVAHGEAVHGCLLSIVWQILDDREAGSAVRAVGEWVEIPAIRGVEHLPAARVANGHIVRDRNAFRARPALENPEPLLQVRGDLVHYLHGVDAGQGG